VITVGLRHDPDCRVGGTRRSRHPLAAFRPVTQRQRQLARTMIAMSTTATMRVMSQPALSADISDMPEMLGTVLSLTFVGSVLFDKKETAALRLGAVGGHKVSLHFRSQGDFAISMRPRDTVRPARAGINLSGILEVFGREKKRPPRPWRGRRAAELAWSHSRGRWSRLRPRDTVRPARAGSNLPRSRNVS
jgi:hypothetical protein